KEPMGAFRFRSRILKPKESAHYTLVMGIVNDRAGIPGICAKFNDKTKTEKALMENRSFWQDRISSIRINTGDRNFDNWVKWVNTQPALRKIFGCSFLPDFDYGKGGKGWRDLWQDCLSLILNDPEEVRPLLMNNFRGVRVDGSNATIIGKDPGEFIADRNNISRVWMDHGVWPLLTTQLYMHQTGDLGILLEETDYFRDHQLSRSGEIDTRWKPEDGKSLKAKNKEVYKGTILEHILIQNLVQFFNVGPHNHIRLEGADWNDGLDMAPEYGESVAFSCMYAQNLMSLSEIIERLPVKEISVLKELGLLLEIITPMDYSDMGAKNKILREYFQSACRQVSGEKISLKKTDLIDDLKKKAGWISAHIRQKEWLPEGFFNGYYNNDKERVEGRVRGVVRMTLTGQVFPVMSAIAGDAQIKQLFASCRKYLKDKKLKGFHLNTDFKDEQLNLGRAFSFIYGDKENGAFFNHMIVMFAYALYKQGFAGEGYEVLDSIYRMALNTKNSKIYPCLPEYFNAEGRGMYSYLTGSASWFMLTLVTQVFGVRGEYGDFLIEPKLSGDQFRNDDTLSISANFAGKDIQVKFINPLKKDFAVYSIKNAVLNGKQIAKNLKTPRLLIPRGTLLASSGAITLEITLD
ncbi:MAG: cellobiose phosphorylase, partial [Candidatus Omnitrophica bacterium]|nr:cellobiose phosphorylase [Candidatus Omnitrophota bacterium]